MKHSFLYDVDAIYLVIFLFVAMLAIILAGYRIGLKKADVGADHGTLLSSLLALLGLLLAFTFGMAGSRYDDRRNCIINESNAIGTAMLRAGLYPDSVAREFKKEFKNYIDARISFMEAGRNEEKLNLSLKQSTEAGNALWQKARAQSFLESQRTATILMIPSLNEVLDSSSLVNESFNITVPDSIVILLLIFSAVSSFFIGYNCGIKKGFDKLLITGFCALTCVVIYIIFDLDRPRRGLIDNNYQVHLMKELKQSL
jgi:hypothetical protein